MTTAKFYLSSLTASPHIILKGYSRRINIIKGMEFSRAIQMVLFITIQLVSHFFVNYRLRSVDMDIVYDGNNSNSVCFVGNYVLCFENLLVRVDHSQGDLKTEPSTRFSNHPGSDQLSQVGSQMSIITSRHMLLFN